MARPNSLGFGQARDGIINTSSQQISSKSWIQSVRGGFAPHKNQSRASMRWKTGRRTSSRREGRGKHETPEKILRPAASSGTIPTCENPGATRPGIETGLNWLEASSLNSSAAASSVVSLHASRQGEPGSISGGVASGFSHVGIVLDDAAGRRVFSGVSRFPRLYIPALLHTQLASPLSALKTPLMFLNDFPRHLFYNRGSRLRPATLMFPAADRRTSSERKRHTRRERFEGDRRFAPRAHSLSGCGQELACKFTGPERSWTQVGAPRAVQRRRGAYYEGYTTQGETLLSGELRPMRVIEVNMERLQNEGVGEKVDSRENPPTNDTVRHDSHLRKSDDPAGD
ncbi:hypothetical protein PR048_021073 [Dryococelus australis]|uniref:Uncharacterized protein n=1 Tax=Dryococelus australis TaxID=614101 RepID=A0ABQ9GX71_9NEOP|nr:hypothetical protein PR048_021073 [Dryococelus australis]